MDWKKYWQKINRENIKTYYYGIPNNVYRMEAIVKKFLGVTDITKYAFNQFAESDTMDMPSIPDLPNLPNPLPKPKFKTGIKWYQPVKDTVIIHDKFNDVFVLFEVANKEKPKFLTTITGLQREKLGDRKFIQFINFLKREM